MSKARDLANAGTALGAVTATELGYVDGVTSAIQTQIDAKEATLPSQTGNSGKYLTTNGTAKSWGTVSQYALPTQTGNSGKFLTTNGTAESWGTVTLPTAWTYRQTLGGSINQIAYNGSNLYVAVGGSGRLYSSPDAITWTSRTSQFNITNIRSVVYGNGTWVAVGNSGLISSSTDGITWTARTANVSTNTLNAVIYANSLFVAVGAGANGGTGGITTSTDGITWTQRSTPTTSATTLQDVAYGGGYYVAVGSANTNNGYYSTNGTSWTVVDTSAGGNQDVTHIKYVNGVWISLKSNNNGGAGINSSTPNTTWSTDFNHMATVSTGVAYISVYGSTLYGISKALDSNAGYPTNVLGPQLIVGVANPGTANISAINPINLPYGYGAQPITGLFINSSNGQIIVMDSAGKVYTSF
jgi:hypothetical protein